MVRKKTSWKTFIDSRHVHTQHNVKKKDVVVPIVRWNQPPQVEVSSLHVFHLPVSQPSQNSSFVVNEDSGKRSIGVEKQVGARGYQLCVFAGTLDGIILYWRFEQDEVAQVNVLVFPGTGRRRYPIVGLVSGIDEWGQSVLISATRDGEMARWQLPNGACAEANASLAKELSPLLGLEMLCNQRFALVVSEVSRLMVLDTWRMQLMHCVDTAQEQIRRSVAVGELSMSRPKSTQKRVIISTNESNVETNSRDESADQAVNRSAEGQRISPSRSSPAGGIDTLFSTKSATAARQNQRWDAVVLSLGAEGLVKCFLWTQPRGSISGTFSSVTGSNVSADNTRGSWWVQRSSWVISWADQAEDVTCSQSTSLKDGDNLNPQTALMGSIKNSYFPLSVQVSSDSSFVLLIWQTKFAVLKRKWLCPLEARSDVQAHSGQDKMSRTAGVGSCRVTPAEFVRQAAAIHGSDISEPCGDGSDSESIYWEDGKFLEDGSIVLWTNAGQVFRFMPAESSIDPAGKFFIFTKDHDRLVPRCESKELGIIEKGTYVTSMGRCRCCNIPLHENNRSQTRRKLRNAWLAEGRRRSGRTSCIESTLPGSKSTLQVVHTCYRGTVGCWTMPAARLPSLTPVPQYGDSVVKARMSQAKETRFYSLMDGFEAAEKAARGDIVDAKVWCTSPRRCCLTHFIIGREETQSSSTFDAVWRTGRQHGHQQRTNGTNLHSAELPTTNPAAANATAPVAPRDGRHGAESEFDQLEVDKLDQERLGCSDNRYLLDVPVIVKGFMDGTLDIELLSQEHMSSEGDGLTKDSATRLQCHPGRVTALAHYCMGLQSTATLSSKAYSDGHTSTDLLKETYFETAQNPFYPPRFCNLAPASNFETKQGVLGSSYQSSLEAKALGGRGSIDELFSDATSSHRSLKFVLFSGGSDGVLRVIELLLYHPAINDKAGGSFRHAARTLQTFHNHRSAIQQIRIAPLTMSNTGCNGGNQDAEHPDRWVATVGEDCKVVVYKLQYLRSSSSRQSEARNMQTKRTGDRFGVEWKCVLQLSEHADSIRGLDWHLERGLLYVECEDQMVYVWSTDTGILERTIPCALVYGGGSNLLDAEDKAGSIDCSIDECSTLSIGNTAVQLIALSVLRSSEQLKRNWTSYYLAHIQSNSTAGKCSETGLQSSQASVYATGSMELFMLSLLLSWGITPTIDQSCRDILGIKPARALYSCALQGFASRALTIPVPWSTPMRSSFVESESPICAGLELAIPDVMPAFARNWQHSSALSASIALGVVSLCMSAMDFEHPKSGNLSMYSVNKEEFQVLWSQLITQYSVVLPECIAQFREPALEELASFGFDPCEYTQLAARTLLSNVIKRLPSSERSILSAEYSAKLHWEMVRLEMKTGNSFADASDGTGTCGNANSTSQSTHNRAPSGNSNSAIARSNVRVVASSLVVERLGPHVLLMSMIGTCFPGEISPACAHEVCSILIYLLQAPERFVASVSSELLTKGLMLFRPYLVDLSSLIVQLLLIDLREKQYGAQRNGGKATPSAPGGSLTNFHEGGTGGSNAAMSLLVEVGAYESAFVLGLLQQEMCNLDRPPGFHESILLCMMELVNAHYLLMCRHLPALISTVMACLDPTKPDRRRRCLSLSTRCLHSLVQRFPMVDFHKETQRLALGTMEAVIVIYDLRTATKWRVLDGHASAVSAVRFRSDGRVLVSYAARDGSVRWWNSGNAGLFGGMLKMHQSCLKEHTLTAVKEGPHSGAPASMGGASAGLKQIIQTCRFHFLTRTEQSRDHESRSNLDEPPKQHILRLTREDASQVQFLL